MPSHRRTRKSFTRAGSIRALIRFNSQSKHLPEIISKNPQPKLHSAVAVRAGKAMPKIS
jgi:hypothetical protein